MKFTMEHDKDLEALILQALLEVERDLSLPIPKISGEVRLKKMEVRVDQN